MALSSKELKKSAMDCGCGRVSDELEDEDGTRTASAAVTSVSQRSTSFWRAVTSSTEHFFEATRATLDSSARAWRAPNHPQAAVITMAAVEDLAARMNTDPLDFITRNLDLAGPRAGQ